MFMAAVVGSINLWRSAYVPEATGRQAMRTGAVKGMGLFATELSSNGCCMPDPYGSTCQAMMFIGLGALVS